MHEIDTSFRQQKKLRKDQRRRQQVKRRWIWVSALCLASLILAGLGFWLDRPEEPLSAMEDDDALQVEETLVPVYVPTIIDLPGDQIRINLGESEGNALKDLPDSQPLTSLGVSGQLHMISVGILESGKRLDINLPSTPQDFAFFQSQRDNPEASSAQNGPEPSAAAIPSQPAEPAKDPDIEGDEAPSEATAGWGDIRAAGISGASTEFEQTEVQNNITVVRLTPEIERFEPTDDVFVRVAAEVSLEKFLTDNHINLLDATRVAAVFKESLEIVQLEAGAIVAMRRFRSGGRSDDRKLVQIAVYLPDKFLGALALTENSEFKTAVDPWVNRNLFAHAEEQQEQSGARFRLLDGIFSASIRSGVPAGIVGEAIMYLSRKHDLSDFAGPDDRLTLLYSDKPRLGGESAGRVLFASLDRSDKSIRCFIFKPADANDFNCLDEYDQSGTIEVGNGMVTPVSGGVMTSRFGPRRHPILKKVLMHKGVDWAAPVGTPVRAAFDGKLVFAGNGGSYGNLIRISHGGGRETRYAHLDAFAASMAPGLDIKAGTVIGFIGTTGRSTGPHLHFELYVGGEAVDPLQSELTELASQSDAVEKLVDRIVHVESGGNATAKNPLSSATGLGQFIDSTWLRMMRTYRPDLANSLPRDKQLALRFDPTLSREMVANLARENKAYLEAGGHSITAGRLYLAHFLGPEGARIVLSNDDSADLQSLLGAGVISANKFLTGKDVAFIKDWAERKMRGRGGAARARSPTVTKPVQQASPEFTLYRKTLLALLGGV